MIADVCLQKYSFNWNKLTNTVEHQNPSTQNPENAINQTHFWEAQMSKYGQAIPFYI